MVTDMYPQSTKDIHKLPHALVPESQAGFHAFSRQVFADGRLMPR